MLQIQIDHEFASGANEIQGCPQGTEITAVKSSGDKIHAQDQQENHTFKGQGMKKDQGHKLPPNQSWRRDKDKDGAAEDHGEEQFSDEGIPEDPS